jgi:orotate phosphoribosyltransferase
VYVNLRALASNTVAFGGITAYLRCIVSQFKPGCIVGIPYAADQLALGVGMSGNHQLSVIRLDKPKLGELPTIYDSREQGPAEMRIVVIDDVISDGGSKIQPISYLMVCEYVVKAVVVVVDRMEGGSGLLNERLGIRTHSLCSIEDIMAELRLRKMLTPTDEEAYAAYRLKYGR